MLNNNQIGYLREKFLPLTGSAKTARLLQLKSIALVGAIPFNNSQSGLSEPDDMLLEKALQTLQSLGYSVSSEFDPKIININEEFGGLDYMAEDNPARYDISIFCYILRIRREQERTKNPDNNYIKNSPNETLSRHAWLRAAIMHQSKVLLTHGRPRVEVGAKDFKGGWFFNKSPYKNIHTEPMPFHGQMSALEGSKLSVMAHRDWA